MIARVLFVTLGLGAALACTANPSIDGSTVAKIGSPGNPPSCSDVCSRATKLCGVTPMECTTADAAGLCDQYFDDTHRLCAGQAATCQAFNDCTNEVADASPAEGGEADATTDAESDATGDAKVDAGADAKDD